MEQPSNGRSGNKTRSYFIYAIGEIALVMIGILLALQVNNWNEERKLQQQEVYLLSELKKEFLQNQRSLDHSFEQNKIGMQSSWDLITLVAEKNPNTIQYQQLDSLADNIIEGFNEFDPTSGVIDDIINSGKLEVIRNDSLRYMLSQWSGQLIDLNQDNYFRNEYFIHKVLPEMTLYLPMVNTLALDNGETQVPGLISTVNYSNNGYSEDLFQNRNFEGVIAMHAANQNFILGNIIQLKDYISHAIQLIEMEQQRFK